MWNAMHSRAWQQMYERVRLIFGEAGGSGRRFRKAGTLVMVRDDVVSVLCVAEARIVETC